MFPDELVIIGVHSAKFPSEGLTENIRQAVMRHGIAHPVVNDAGFKIWSAYAVRAWPTLVLIDPRGRIAGEVSGEILAEEFAQEIQAVIDQNPGAIDRAPLDFRPELQQEPERPLKFPARLLAAENTLFVADTGHHRILQIELDADGLGGKLVRAFGSGDGALRDGAADIAAFHQPHGLGLLSSPQDGTLFVADTENHAVRAIDLASGEVRTLAGNGQKAHGRLRTAEDGQLLLRSPWAVLPLEGYLFIAMAGSHQVWVRLEDGQLGPFAGNGYEALEDGPAAEASFNQPSDISFGAGYLFVADPEASAVRAITLRGTPRVTTLVGQGLFDWGDQDGPTREALLQHPAGLAFFGGVLYLADTYNNKIKVLDPEAGAVRTLIGDGKPGWQDGVFGSARLFEPEGLQVHAGRLYIADTNNHQIRVALLETGELHTFRLRGVGRIPSVGLGRNAVETLPMVDVAPGQVWLTLDVRLPDGYRRSPDNPAAILPVDGAGSAASPLYFDAGESIRWPAQVDTDSELSVELSLYYCQAENAQLCLIHNRTLAFPVRVKYGAPAEVVIRYEVQQRFER